MRRPAARLLAVALALCAASASAQVEHAPPPPDPDALPASAAPAVAAPGERESAWTVSGGVASRYVFRGLDLSDGDPQAFAGASYARGGLYAGAWASNVDLRRFGGGAGAEVDAYGGWRGELGGYAVDLGAIAYAYAGEPGRFSYGELYAKGSRAIGPVTLGAALNLSPEFRGRAGFGAYAELNAAYALTRRLSLAAALGGQTLSKAPDDWSWSVGATYALTDRLGLDLRYADTDAHALGQPYGGKVVASLRASFR